MRELCMRRCVRVAAKKWKAKAKKKRLKRKEVKKEDGSHSSLITKREKGVRK